MNYLSTYGERANVALTRPTNFGTTDARAFSTHGAVYSVNRDSDALERSNFAQFQIALVGIGDDDSVYVMGCRHWTVGWIDHLMVRVYDDNGNYTPEFVAACDVLDQLDNYAVLDEMHYSELEHADNHPDADSLCYSDDDCECGRERA